MKQTLQMIDTEWLELLLSYCISHHTIPCKKTLGSSFLQVPEWWAAKELILAKVGSTHPCSAKTADALVVRAIQKEKWPSLHAKWGILIWILWWVCVTISQQLTSLSSDFLRQYLRTTTLFLNTLLIFSRARCQRQAAALAQRQSTALLPKDRSPRNELCS